MVAQIGGGLVAVAEVDELGEVEIEAVVAPPLGGGLHALDRLLVIGGVDIRHAFHGHPAAGRAELGDRVEQPVLSIGRQVAQQALGTPGRRLARVEALFDQCRRPVVAQIHRDRAALGGWFGAQFGQGPCLELDDVWLVDLIHCRPRGPCQPVSARIQARRQDHRLADATFGSAEKKLVEELGPHRHVVGHPLHADRLTVAVEVLWSQLAGDKAGEEIHTHRAHQWLGERIIDQRVVGLGGHRAGRCHHGVAPTLDARSHVSLSVRAIR